MYGVCAMCVCLFMYLLFDGSTTFRFRFHFCVRPFGGSDVSDHIYIVAVAEVDEVNI